MYRVGICDDENGTCSELEQLIYCFGEKQARDIEVDIRYTGENLCASLEKGSIIDILFLDIELISTDGIMVGSYIREKLENFEISIIYISSKSSYAMSLFRVQPIDFLIKPLTQEMIDEVMSRSIRQYELKNQTFECRSKGNYYKVPYKEIIYFYSDNKKINIVQKDKTLQFNGKLKKVAQYKWEKMK